MNNDIKVGIGVDASGMKAGMSQIKKELDDLKKKTKEGFFDLEGEKRVERNLGAMVQGLANATSGAEALAIGLDRIENVFKSSIGASVAVAAVGTVINLLQEAKKQAEEFKKAFRDSINSANTGSAEGMASELSKQMKLIEAEVERLSGWQSRTRHFASKMFGGDGIQEEADRLKNAISELDRIRTEMNQKRLDESKAAALKAEDELNAQILKEDLATIEERNRLEEEGWKKRDEQEKKDREAVEKAKASFAIDEWKKYWQEMTNLAKQYDDARKEAEKNRASFAVDKAKEQWQAFEDLAAAGRKRADLEAAKGAQDREAAIQNELKRPEERLSEKQAARDAERAEDRAIKRIAQRAQDKQNSSWRNQRMTNEDRDALANKLRQQRAEDKKPQMEKDISEINQAIKKLEQKIGVQ